MTTHTNPPLWTGAFVRICLVNLFIFVNFHALHAADRRRRDYCLHYTGCDWGDRRYYHALIDSGRTDALGVLRALAQQQG